VDNNPFQPPKSGFERPPRDPEPGSLLKAVLVGVSVDIGGTIVGGLMLGVVYSVVLAMQGVSEAQMEAMFTEPDPFSLFSMLSTALGLSMSALGGYFCARTANVNSYTALGIMSAISVTAGTLMGADSYEWTTLLLLNLLGLVCIFVGGWWFIRTLPSEQ
jgi:putative Mn2+ efflux pump MntP